MTKKELQNKKQELGYTNQTLSDLTGIPVPVIERIFETEDYTADYETMRRLRAVLAPSTDMVKEAAPNYGKLTDFTIDPARQGHYTLEDYHRIPDDIRMELIDGVLFTMEAPTVRHQDVAGYVYNTFFNHIRRKKGACRAMISPVDVQLDCDNRTMVQPDVIILCDSQKNINRCIYGAPDFVMEVLSKSTKKKDMSLKLHKYQNAGVREYWIADPQKKTVLVYRFESDDFGTIYGPEERIPVGIWDGDLEIDLKDMWEYCEA